ncbi:MAG: glycosyltransferase family 39 protein [Desulfurococcales archaeon]|nr:glycosyltransferase family 39 protein [Desulfurococcales archaeon]
MLSYADRSWLLWVSILLLSVAVSSIFVYYSASGLAHLYEELGKEYVSDEIYYVDTARRILQNVFKVDIDYWSYSGKTDEDYYNLEHPPLGKYIIALSMLVCGDEPLCWRLPGILEASMIPVIIALAYTGRRPPMILAASSAAMAAGSDYILRTAGAVAMLDIHLAFFTALTILAAARGRLGLASIMAGAAASVKMSGVAAVLALIVYIAYAGWMSRRERIRTVVKIVLISLTVYIVMYVPLASYFGPVELVKENINALKWHTTSRPADGPPTSTPTGWIFNVNPFYYSVSGALVSARLNTLIHLPALVAALIITMYHLDRGRERMVFSSILYMSIIITYYLVFVMGNRTLYSFYAVQLTPAAAGVLAEISLLASGGSGTPKTLEGDQRPNGGGDGGSIREARAQDPGAGEAQGGAGVG